MNIKLPSFRKRVMLKVNAARRNNDQQFYGELTTQNAIISRKAHEFITANPPKGKALFLLG